MISKAVGRYIRISPSKVRLVVDLVKGKSVEEASYILDNTNKRACRPLKKVLDSAFANANQNRQEKLLSADLFLSQVKADGGPYLMRYRAATMGRATPVRHRTSHIYVELDLVDKGKEAKEAKPAAKKAPAKSKKEKTKKTK